MEKLRNPLKVLALCLAVVLVTSLVLAAGNINFALGQRSLDNSDYDPVDQQTFFGASVDWDNMEWPVSLAGGLYFSQKSDSISSSVDVTASVTEATFGVIKSWHPHGTMTPYVGGGLGIVHVNAEVDAPGTTGFDASDTAAALYSEGGIYWRMGSAFNLGVHARYMMAPGTELEGEDFDTNYFQIGLLAGWAWGTR